MTFVKCQPEKSLINFSDVVQSMFDDFLPTQQIHREHTWTPRMDISQTKDNFNIIAEIPGLTKKDVKITLKEKQLIISGEKKLDNEEKTDNFLHTERLHGKFERVFNLPNEIITDKVEADVKDGILTIKLPKSEKVKPKEITINAHKK